MGKWMGLVLVVPAFLATVLFQSVRGRFVDFECEHCGNHFSVSPITATLAPHEMGGRKRLRCPECNATGWASPMPK